jgi:hypothetical protein
LEDSILHKHFKSVDLKPVKKRKLAHNEHLVGVELNPGPKTEIDLRIKGANNPKKGKKNGRQSRSGATGLPREYRNSATFGPITKAYLEMLCDPLDSPPLRSGFMTWTPTQLCSAYVRGTLLTTSDGFIAMVNPDACLSSSAVTTNLLSDYFSFQQFTGNTLTTGCIYTGAPNRSAITTQLNSNRVCASGLEIIVAQPETATPGILGVVRLNGVSSIAALDAYGPNNYMGIPGIKIYTTVAGSATLKVNWLPSDSTDFEFSNNTTYDNGEGLFNPIIIFGTGFPTGTRVFYDAITHIEGQVGTNNSGMSQIAEEKAGPPSPAFQPALVDEHSNPEQFMRRSNEILATASDKIQYSTDKPFQISDIISETSNLYDQVAKKVEALGRNKYVKRARDYVASQFKLGRSLGLFDM